ncbi:ferredoxin [Paenibacillaceae bacterium]|nr:ferredoxin [Paenibacillaceae bacterium]
MNGIKITFLPSGKSVVVRAGISVLDASRRAGVVIATRCQGKAACMMCKVVHRADSGLSEPTGPEILKLGGLEQTGIRLSCQARVIGEVVVEVPETPLQAAVRRKLAEQQEDDGKLW